MPRSKRKLEKAEKFAPLTKKSRHGKLKYRVEGCFDFVDEGVSTTQVIAKLKTILKKAGMPDKNFSIEATQIK